MPSRRRTRCSRLEMRLRQLLSSCSCCRLTNASRPLMRASRRKLRLRQVTSLCCILARSWSSTFRYMSSCAHRRVSSGPSGAPLWALYVGWVCPVEAASPQTGAVAAQLGAPGSPDEARVAGRTLMPSRHRASVTKATCWLLATAAILPAGPLSPRTATDGRFWRPVLVHPSSSLQPGAHWPTNSQLARLKACSLLPSCCTSSRLKAVSERAGAGWARPCPMRPMSSAALPPSVASEPAAADGWLRLTPRQLRRPPRPDLPRSAAPGLAAPTLCCRQPGGKDDMHAPSTERLPLH